MPVSNGNSIDAIRGVIHSLEVPRSEGKTGSETGSKILHTPNATYHGGKKK